ncbi:MAG: HisS family protein, partial [Desulfurococcaceae archaeon]
MTEFNPPRGMRDIIDEEAELYEYLFQEFRETARRRGFQPIITPTVEYFSLFEAKSGEEIRKSMYVFEDKGGRLLALRPEVTASIIRVYLRHMRSYPKPIRLYYLAQCYRYEEPQYARYREFWQGGLEIIGDPDASADILVAMTASEFLDKIGLKHRYEVGNVALYRGFMKRYGLSEELQDHILHLIDKDMVNEALNILAEKIGDNVDVFKRILETNDLERVESLIHENREFLGEQYMVISMEQRRLYELIKSLRELGYSINFQPRLVRGLAYYTGLIFEYKLHGQESFPSIGGGGRYDGLTIVYGGAFEHSTGLALGLDRIALALSTSVSLPKYKT